MNQTLGRYRIEHARLVAERFEEETVLVNVESGYYYSLSPSGAEILELLNEGIQADKLAPALFGDSQNCERFRSRIAAFVAQLADEGIIVEREPGSTTGKFSGSPLYPAEADYEAPVFERFDDVRDLLLIDPVHQVDPDFGWPTKKPLESLREPGI